MKRLQFDRFRKDIQFGALNEDFEIRSKFIILSRLGDRLKTKGQDASFNTFLRKHERQDLVILSLPFLTMGFLVYLAFVTPSGLFGYLTVVFWLLMAPKLIKNHLSLKRLKRRMYKPTNFL